jgi:hypothetical protein
MGFGNFNIFNKAPQEVPEERKLSVQELRIFNDMQRQLMLHYENEHTISPDDEEARRKIDLEWIEKYAPEFAKLRAELLTQNPHLLEDWLEHPDQVSKDIEREVKIRLYHESDSSAGATQQAA